MLGPLAALLLQAPLVEQVVTEGEALLLRRLDVLRVPAAATLRHPVLGEIAVAAGAEITAGNASGLLSPSQLDQVARLIDTMRTDHHVLLGGASGVGKELAARALHAMSSRASLPHAVRYPASGRGSASGGARRSGRGQVTA